MKILNFAIIFAILGTTILFSSCSKDDDQEEEQGQAQALTGTYNFTSISDDNPAYGFIRENGEAVEVASADIDRSIFNEASQVHQVDNIEILSETTLSYTGYDIWAGNSGESRTAESDYTISDGILEFTFTDEFGNEDPILMVIDGDKLILKVIGIVDVWNGNPLTIEVYDENPNFGYAPENAANRLSQDEGDEIYVLVYDQIYE